MAVTAVERSELLRPYVPRLLIEWLRDTPEQRVREVEGTLAFVDISGFTSLTERLAKLGKVGAEELDEILDPIFAELLSVAYADGAQLVKWGGDAALLLFTGEGHPVRACRAAHRMRRAMRRIGRLRTSIGTVTLRMSVGIHTGSFHFFVVGSLYRELVIAGPGATTTATMEAIAEAGEVAVSDATAALIEPAALGDRKGAATLLVREPRRVPRSVLEPPPRLDGLDLGRCVPPSIRDFLLSRAVEPEHRPVTVAFIEFSGVDALLRAGEVEHVTDAIDGCVSAAQEAAGRFGIPFIETDISKDGGKIMLVAGAPTTTGADEERMLLAVRAVADSPRLGLRVGVNAGHVFAAEFGPAFRKTYTVKGDAVNLAARLMAHAGPGQILVAPVVLEAASREFAAAPVEPFLVKGKARPVHAAALGAPLGVRVRTGDEHVPLVGRTKELELLNEALRAAEAQRGYLVEVVAEPGMGKSRLLQEFAWGRPGTTFLSATAQEYERSTPYAVARSLFRQAIGIDAQAGPASAGSTLREVARQRAPDVVPWLPFLGLVVDADVPPSREAARVAEENRVAVLHAAAGDLLSALLPPGSVIVVEDLHWADEVSLALLTAISRTPSSRRWVVVATRRDEGYPLLDDDAVQGVRIPLAPLDLSDSAGLIRTLAAETALSAHTVAALVERAGGNPLFARELVASVVAAGETAALPDTIEAVIGARIDRLAPADRRLLRYASVLGPIFDDDLLAFALATDGVELQASAWSRLGDLVVRDVPGQGRFRHALIRDVAYEGLAYRRRRDVHCRVGSLVESRATDLEDVAEVLSLHFHLGQDHERSWRYSLMAGDRAKAKFAHVQAAQFFERAIVSGRKVAASGDELAAAYESLADVCERAGLLERAAAAYAAARRAHGSRATPPRLFLKQGLVAERLANHRLALRWFTRGLRQPATEESAEDRIELTLARASTRYWQGDYPAGLRYAEEGARLAERVGSRAGLAHAYFLLHVGHTHLGTPDRERYRGLALPIYEELGDLAQVAKVLNNLGVEAYFEGRWTEALDLYRRASEAHEQVGSTVWAAMVSHNIAEILSDQGRLAEAEPLLREAFDAFRAARERNAEAYAMVNLARLASRGGRFAEADPLFQGADRLFEDMGNLQDRLMTQTRMAEHEVLRGDHVKALPLAARTLRELRRAGGMPVLEASLLRTRAYGLAQQGDLDRALAESDDAVRVAEAAQAGYELGLGLEARSRLRSAAGHPGAGDDRGRSKEILEALGVVATPDVPIG